MTFSCEICKRARTNIDEATDFTRSNKGPDFALSSQVSRSLRVHRSHPFRRFSQSVCTSCTREKQVFSSRQTERCRVKIAQGYRRYVTAYKESWEDRIRPLQQSTKGTSSCNKASFIQSLFLFCEQNVQTWVHELARSVSFPFHIYRIHLVKSVLYNSEPHSFSLVSLLYPRVYLFQLLLMRSFLAVTCLLTRRKIKSQFKK